MVAQLIRTLHLVWAPELRDRLKADTRGQEMLAMSVEELRLRTSISGLFCFLLRPFLVLLVFVCSFAVIL